MARVPGNTTPGSGGLTVPPDMQALVDTPGYLSSFPYPGLGEQLRKMYQTQSSPFNPQLLSPFGFACCLGILDRVIMLVESGTAPPLDGTETPFKWGYATLVVNGAHATVSRPPEWGRYAEVLTYLFSRGLAPDVQDIVGYTALHHCGSNARTPPALARVLLEKGHANPDVQDKYGGVPLMPALQTGNAACAELLAEFGANLDIVDGDKLAPCGFMLRCGPQVVAAVTRGQRKRSGQEAPLQEKKCDGCGKQPQAAEALKNCSACRAVRYCSKECQRTHWKTHKQHCQPFSAANTVTLVPNYMPGDFIVRTSEVTRSIFGIPTAAGALPDASTPMTSSSGHVPRRVQREGAAPKQMMVKVQVPWMSGAPAPEGPLMVYNRKRDFVCQVERAMCPAAYDRVMRVVHEKGVGGAKAYFAAELVSKDALVVKVGEVLAEQPF